MFTYSYAGLWIESSKPLPELDPAPCASGSCLSVAFETTDTLGPFESTFELERQGSILHRQRQDASGTRLRFDDASEFSISADLTHVSCRSTPVADRATVRHYLLDSVLPRVLGASGSVVLHTSGVEHRRGALLFMGDSGSGKSTLAASLHRRGLGHLGDDAFLLLAARDEVRAVATYGGLRLLPKTLEQLYGPEQESLSVLSMGDDHPKRRVVDRSIRSSRPPVGVAAIFHIDGPDQSKGPAVARRLPGRDAMLAVMRNSFRLDVTGDDSISASLDQALAISSAVPLYSLRYHRDFKRLDDLHAAVLNAVES